MVLGTWAGTHTTGRASFSHHGVHSTVTRIGIKDRSPCVIFTQSGGTRSHAGVITHSTAARIDTADVSQYASLTQNIDARTWARVRSDKLELM
jgi:acetyl-CoA carboxylase carboxyltransferase component